MSDLMSGNGLLSVFGVEHTADEEAEAGMPQERPVELLMKLPNKTITLTALGSDTVKSVKRRIEEQEGYKVSEQVLSLDTKPMSVDKKRLSQYGIYNQCTIQVQTGGLRGSGNKDGDGGRGG